MTRLLAALLVAMTPACAPMACVTAAALEAAPPVEVAGAPGLLVRMGRELLLAAARRGCESGTP